MDKRATYTTIVHKSLRESGLSVVEFFVADVVDKLSNPWCYMLREELGNLVGVTRMGLFKILRRLEEGGYIEKSSKGLRSTQKWKDLSYTEECKQSLHDVPKVYIERKQSLHEDVNKVYPSIYIKDNNNDKGEALSDEEKSLRQLPSFFGKTPLVRLTTFYSLLWWDSFGTRYKPNYGAIGKNINPLLDSLTEWQIAALIWTHFNWYGSTGEDERAQKSLESAMYPILWIPSKVNEYSTYITNCDKVDFDNQAAIKAWVKAEIKDVAVRAHAAGIIKITSEHA